MQNGLGFGSPQTGRICQTTIGAVLTRRRLLGRLVPPQAIRWVSQLRPWWHGDTVALVQEGSP
jgi:hypothetical protein